MEDDTQSDDRITITSKVPNQWSMLVKEIYRANVETSEGSNAHLFNLSTNSDHENVQNPWLNQRRRIDIQEGILEDLEDIFWFSPYGKAARSHGCQPTHARVRQLGQQKIVSSKWQGEDKGGKKQIYSKSGRRIQYFPRLSIMQCSRVHVRGQSS